MELPLGTEGRTATHDFLSLYSPSSGHAQQDPQPPQGGHLKTHDFLQPLEREGKHEKSTKEETRVGTAAMEKPQVPSHAASVQHPLPGGIGTYSISYLNQRASMQEGSRFTTAQACSTTRNDENSNCSSYTGSGFTLWDESAAKKGKTGKENIASHRHVLQGAGVNVSGGQWTLLLDKPLLSSSHHKHSPSNFSSFSSSQLSSSQNNQNFMDVITSAKNEQEEDGDDDHEDRFVIKKELSSHPKGNFSVKIESNTIDQKPSTPRSKHSATEQRRRSKINDRFQKLREIIPNSEQKRDKASFLLEVIDYVHFLQEKVNRYESPYNAWSHESSSKMAQLRNINPTQGAKPETCSVDKNKASIPTNGRNLIDSDISTAANFKERGEIMPNVQQSIFTFGRSTIPTSVVSPKPVFDRDHKTTTWAPPRPMDGTDSGQEMTIESGCLNTSSVYSQGLLNTLTKALHNSGVDMSRASISVQIDLGDKDVRKGENHTLKKLRSG